METTSPETVAEHHPEYVRAIREAAARLEWQYMACFHVALKDSWSEETKQDALSTGLALLGAATDILDKIGEEPALVAQEKQRLAAEREAASAVP